MPPMKYCEQAIFFHGRPLLNLPSFQIRLYNCYPCHIICSLSSIGIVQDMHLSGDEATSHQCFNSDLLQLYLAWGLAR